MIPAPWSPSGLAEVKNCPKQFHETRVLKRFRQERNTYNDWGDRVHTAFERFFLTAMLPQELTAHEDYLQKLNNRPGRLWVEQKVAFNKQAQPCTWDEPLENLWARFKIDFLKVDAKAEVPIAWVRDWKGLPLDTLISTPNGFVTMGELQVGDMVHASDGLAYPVTAKSPVQFKPCLRVTFDDKTSVVCDNEHLWSLENGSVVSVTQLRKGDKIPIARPVEMPTQLLPIDPYVLGLWLADGKHTSSEVSKPDQEIWDEVVRRGYALGENTGKNCPTRTIKGIRAFLILLDLFRNKHIPPIYLKGSIAQRVDLLRGLMDGDGYANPIRKQAYFSNTNKRLSDDLKVLVESLGCRANQAKVKYSGFGVTGVAYPVAWRPRYFNPFFVPRKATPVNEWGRSPTRWRRVISVTDSPIQQTQCIAIASPDSTYLCTSSRIVTHNTGKQKDDFLQLIIYALWTFAAHPVDLVDVRYYWLQSCSETRKVYGREEVPALWEQIMPDLMRWRDTFKKELWLPKQSGLCRGYCPVVNCEHWEPKRS